MSIGFYIVQQAPTRARSSNVQKPCHSCYWQRIAPFFGAGFPRVIYKALTKSSREAEVEDWFAVLPTQSGFGNTRGLPGIGPSENYLVSILR